MCDFDIFFFFFLVLFPVSLLGREGRYQDIDRERHSRKRGRRDMSDKEDRGLGLLGSNNWQGVMERRRGATHC